MTVPNPAQVATTNALSAICPVWWCAYPHRDHVALELELISHESEEFYPGVSIMRTDNLDEGTIGELVLYVDDIGGKNENEIADWSEAAKLIAGIVRGMQFLDEIRRGVTG